MNKSTKPVFFMLLFTGLILLIFLLMQPLQLLFLGTDVAVLFPKGIIAWEERSLLFIIQALMLLVIIPVYILTFVFSWRYRAGNEKAIYDPDLVDHRVAEFIWWGLPLVMVLVIAGITWVKTYELDPYKPIASEKAPLHVQVVALQWKWLFLYPEEQIASLNFLQFPQGRPVRFEITADAPMNSFWIPHLGGQIYAMPGMRTELNLIADEAGEFRGSSANISGEGFAGMHFIAKASSSEDFDAWVQSVKGSPQALNFQAYQLLAAPSQNNPAALYQFSDDSLFQQIIMKYMAPAPASPEAVEKKI